MAFAPDYATSGQFYAYVTRGPGRPRSRSASTAAPGNADVADRPVAASCCRSRTPRRPTTTAGSCSSGRTGSCRWHRRRRWRRRQLRPRAEPGSTARQAAADRRRRTPCRRSSPRACATRGASRSTPDGRIVIADVGQNRCEEINVGLAPNYGWPCFEGRRRTLGRPGLRRRRARRSGARKGHEADDGFCAITGGYVVRDPGLPTLLGRYVYGDNCATALRSVDLANAAGDAPVGADGAARELVRRGRVRAAARREAQRARVPRLSTAPTTPRAWRPRRRHPRRRQRRHRRRPPRRRPRPTATPTPTPTPTATPRPPTASPTATPTPTPTPPGDAPADPLRRPEPLPATAAHRGRPCRAPVRGLDARHRPRLARPPRYLSVALRTDRTCRATVSATRLPHRHRCPRARSPASSSSARRPDRSRPRGSLPRTVDPLVADADGDTRASPPECA